MGIKCKKWRYPLECSSIRVRAVTRKSCRIGSTKFIYSNRIKRLTLATSKPCNRRTLIEYFTTWSKETDYTNPDTSVVAVVAAAAATITSWSKCSQRFSWNVINRRIACSITSIFVITTNECILRELKSTTITTIIATTTFTGTAISSAPSIFANWIPTSWINPSIAVVVVVIVITTTRTPF